MANTTGNQKAPCVMELEAGTHYWCSCGKSANQPFCDGSHKETGLTPVSFELTEKTQVSLCGCKCTENTPYCDGSHNNLSE